MAIFYLKFSMMNSNSKLNECESEPESESAPANIKLPLEKKRVYLYVTIRRVLLIAGIVCQYIPQTRPTL